MLLMKTELSASMGPSATASESARLYVPKRDAVTATRTNPITLPVRTPATSVSPPRTSGLSTARVSGCAGALSGVGVVKLSRNLAPTGLCGGGAARTASGRKRRFVVGMVRHFLDVLGVPDLVVAVQHEDRAALDAQLLDKRPVLGAERPVLVVGQHLHL